MAREKLLIRNETNKKYYDIKTQSVRIEAVGDLILIKNPKKKSKFDNQYNSPYRVIDTNENYVTGMRKSKPYRIHENNIKKSEANHESVPPEAFQVIEPNEGDFNDLFKKKFKKLSLIEVKDRIEVRLEY